MDILIRNIASIAQTVPGHHLVSGKEMDKVQNFTNAFLLIRNGLIDSFGPMEEIPNVSCTTLDAKGGMVLPGFVDCHTHLVFAASREKEFVMKIHGASYADIARAGGGILNSAQALRSISEDELLERSLPRLKEVMRKGTVALEIKSGYGLNTESELKMLRVARRLSQISGVPIRTTFLGAHSVPTGIDKKDYIRLVIEEMIPAVAAEQLADFIDVFCEQGFFNPDESVQILETGKRFGMTPRVHANQLATSGGVQVAVKTKAASADHLEHIGEEEIEVLKNSTVVPVALPGAAFFLRMPYTPARKLIDAGLSVAVASDYNPGSAPSGNMMMMWSLSCVGMKMTPAEALNALTINPSIVLGLQHSHGSIFPGKAGSVIITKPIPSFEYLPYHFGMDAIESVIISGKKFV